MVIPSSVQCSRSCGTPPRSVRAEAAADTTDAPPAVAPDSNVTVAVDNPPNISARIGVPLETIAEIDERSEESQNPNNDNVDQPESQLKRNNALLRIWNEETLNGNEAVAETSQRRGVKRKADDHDGASETMDQLNQSLLECPVCLMPQCRRGQLVCSLCCAHLASCPVCLIPFTSTCKQVAAMLRQPCRHGCGRKELPRLRAVHEASCAERRYPCPAPACAQHSATALHSHEQLQLHLQSEHAPMVKQGRRHTFSVQLDSVQDEHWFAAALREVFHVRVDVAVRTRVVAVHVAYLGPRCNASRYTYQVTVEGLTNRQRLVYSRATHSDLESYFLNLSRKDCFRLSFDQALNFLRNKNRHYDTPPLVQTLNFTVEIIKSDAAPE